MKLDLIQNMETLSLEVDQKLKELAIKYPDFFNCWGYLRGRSQFKKKSILKSWDEVDKIIRNLFPYEDRVKWRNRLIASEIRTELEYTCQVPGCKNYRTWGKRDLKKCFVFTCTNKDKTHLDFRECSQKERTKKSNLIKFGFEYPCGMSEHKEKIKASLLKKYGVDHYSKTPEFNKQMKETCQKRYGVDYFSQSPEFNKRVKETSQKRYGVDHYLMTPESIKVRTETNLKKYGAISWMHSEEGQKKIRFDNMDKYGVEFYSQREEHKEHMRKIMPDIMNQPEVKEKHRISCQEKYGVDNYSQSEHHKENYQKYQDKSKETCQKLYGADYYMQSEQSKENCQERYGADYYIQSEQAKENMNTIDYQIQELCSALVISEYNFLGSYLRDNKSLDVKKFMLDFDCSETSTYVIFRKYDIEYKSSNQSNAETEIIDFIKASYPNLEIIQGSRNVINPKEIDIFIPSLGLAIEYNGIMFHTRGVSEYSMYHKPDFPMDYHLKKTELCEAKGIQLIHIREDQFKENPDQVFQDIKETIDYKLHGSTYQPEQDTYIIPRDLYSLNSNIFIDRNFTLVEILPPQSFNILDRIYYDSGSLIYQKINQL